MATGNAEQDTLLQYRITLDYAKQKVERLLLSILAHQKISNDPNRPPIQVEQSARTLKHDRNAHSVATNDVKLALEALDKLEAPQP